MKDGESSKEEKKEEPFSDAGEFDPNLKNKISVSGHKWVQRGYEIECRNCELHHGTYIGAHNLLVGIDENGMPRFTKRS